MRRKTATAFHFFGGSLLFILFCLEPPKNPFDPSNPDYKRPQIIFDTCSIPKSKAVTDSVLYCVVHGNYKESLFRWKLKRPDSVEPAKWIDCSDNGDEKYAIRCTVSRAGDYVLHIRTAYHWEADITDSAIVFSKVDIPVITAQSGDIISKSAVQACTLWVKAKGTAPLSYQWYKGSTVLDGKTKDTLIFSSLAMSDTGRYNCFVSNTWGSDTSKQVRIAVDMPVIVAQSGESMPKTVAQACTLWVKAKGTAPLSYQWYKGSAALDGKTNDTLIYSSLAISDTGRYCCFVSNAWGSDTSKPVRLVMVPSEYRVLYDGNNATSGTVPIDPKSYKRGDIASVMRNIGKLERTGYTFADWSITADGTGKLYTAGDTLIIDSTNVKLFAKWLSIQKHTVTFDANGGLPEPNQQLVSHGGKVSKPLAPEKPDSSFVGWCKDSLCTIVWNFTSDTVTLDMTLYAKWTVKTSATYTVTFDAKGGLPAPAQQTVKSGDHLTKPDDPKKPGFSFGGWFTDSLYSNEWSFTGDVVNGPMTLYAKWTVKQDTVVFNILGGTPPPPPSQIVKEGGKLTEPSPAPKKTGYDFKGWCKDSLCTIAWAFATDTVTGNMTLYAKWVPLVIKFDTVTFDATGGIPVPAQQIVMHGGTIAKPTLEPQKSGHDFIDWFKDAQGTTAWNFQTDTVAGNMVLYATWIPTVQNKFTVLFNSMGGSTVPPQTIDSGAHATEPSPAPAKTGYNFKGWCKDSLCTTAWDFPTGVITAKTTLYAKWEIKKYSVIFNAHGGTPVPSAQTVDSGNKVTKPYPPAKTDSAFIDWFKELTSTIAWNFSSDIVTGPMTLHAKWGPTFKVKYFGNNHTNGTPPIDNAGYAQGTTVTIQSNSGNLQKMGYTFDGWSKIADGSGKTYLPGDTLIMPGGEVQLYAKWFIKKYRVTFDAHGGAPMPPAQTVDSGGKVTRPSANPGKADSAFIDWFKELTGTTAWNFSNDIVTGPMTLHAKWAPKFRVVYDGNTNTGGTPPTDNTKYAQGATVTVLDSTAGFRKTGYTFSGWNTKADSSGKTYKPGDTLIMGTADVCLYAKWTIKKYTVTFDAHGGLPVPPAQTVDSGGKVTRPSANPQKVDSAFIDWFMTLISTTAWNFSSDIVTGPMTLNAKWASKFRVVYDGNTNTGGTPPSDTFKYVQGATVTVKPNSGGLLKTGFTFAAWNTAANGSGKTCRQNETLIMGTADIYLFANWGVKDTDGNIYTTVTIGSQIWTAENLKTIHYNDGAAIPLVTDSAQWIALSTPGYCWYDNNEGANKPIYGALYNWHTVSTGKLAPAGWHVPTDAEWSTLTTFLGGESMAGGKLKEAGLAHWPPPNNGATNETGFSALPGGFRSNVGHFDYQSVGGLWWSTTEFDASYAWNRSLYVDTSLLYRGNYYKRYGFSVRLVRD